MNNNDGCSATCKSEFCFQFTNTANEDLPNNNWFDACVAAPGNNVGVTLYDANNNVIYQATGTKVGVWNQNQITSTAATNTQYLWSNHDRMITLNNGDKLMIAGKASNNSGCGGSMGNGYGMVIYPANPNYYSNQKLMIYPYRLFIGTNNPRNFNGWTPTHEISWNNGNTMNSCNGPLPSYVGRFQFRVF